MSYSGIEPPYSKLLVKYLYRLSACANSEDLKDLFVCVLMHRGHVHKFHSENLYSMSTLFQKYVN